MSHRPFFVRSPKVLALLFVREERADEPSAGARVHGRDRIVYRVAFAVAGDRRDGVGGVDVEALFEVDREMLGRAGSGARELIL